MYGSVRVDRLKAAVFTLLGILMILGLLLTLLRSRAPDCVRLPDGEYSLRVEDDADIAAFLTACGCAPGDCVSDRTITVPKTWNSVYTAYNDLQEAQGLTLVPYKGAEARELIYAVEGGDCAVVLVARDRIIAVHRSTMIFGDAPRPLIEPGNG